MLLGFVTLLLCDVCTSRLSFIFPLVPSTPRASLGWRSQATSKEVCRGLRGKRPEDKTFLGLTKIRRGQSVTLMLTCACIDRRVPHLSLPRLRSRIKRKRGRKKDIAAVAVQQSQKLCSPLLSMPLISIWVDRDVPFGYKAWAVDFRLTAIVHLESELTYVEPL